jgi:hypothetical protein
LPISSDDDRANPSDEHRLPRPSIANCSLATTRH